MDYLPTTKQIEYFLSVAEHMSFSKAAEECHVTQSTLSAGIAALETLLGHNLFERAGRTVRLTSLGETAIPEARKMLEHGRNITAMARSKNQPLTGTLKMGIIPTIAPYLLPQLLPSLQKQFPNLSLQLQEEQSGALVELCTKGAVDMILLAFPYEMPNLRQVEMLSEKFFLACPQDRWHKKTASIDDLEGQELLLLEEGHCLREHALAACSFRPKAKKDAFNATSLATLIQFVQHGYGITLLPEMAVNWGNIPKGINIVPFKSPAPQRQVGFAWRKNHPREKEFMLLTKAIKGLLKKAG